MIMKSYLYFLDLRLPEVTHIGDRSLIHKGRIISIGLRQANLIGYVRIDPLVGSGLGGKGRIVLLHQLLLHSDVTLLLVPLLVADHLQVLYLGLRCGGKTLLHPLSGSLESTVELLTLVLVFYYVRLTHRQF